MESAKELLKKASGNMSLIPQSVPRSLLIGNENVAALVSIDPNYQKLIEKDIAAHDIFKEFFVSENIDKDSLYKYFLSASDFVQSEISSLRGCAMMANVYRYSPGATVSALVVKQCIYHAKWFLSAKKVVENTELQTQISDTSRQKLSRSEMFACIAMFESGSNNLDPAHLEEVFAMSSGNSLYIIGALTCDFLELPEPSSIHRIIGNIGRAGITFLISPPEVKLREANPENWKFIDHKPFDGKLNNYFNSTSVHLSFTEYEIPIVPPASSRHVIDRDMVLLETLLSIHDKSVWVGEIDVCAILKHPVECVLCTCSDDEHNRGNHKSYQEALKINPQLSATEIQIWDELIEPPQIGSLAVSTHKDWVARLAAASVCAKIGFKPIILPWNPCWKCCGNLARVSSNSSSGRIAFVC